MDTEVIEFEEFQDEVGSYSCWSFLRFIRKWEKYLLFGYYFIFLYSSK